LSISTGSEDDSQKVNELLSSYQRTTLRDISSEEITTTYDEKSVKANL